MTRMRIYVHTIGLGIGLYITYNTNNNILYNVVHKIKLSQSIQAIRH